MAIDAICRDLSALGIDLSRKEVVTLQLEACPAASLERPRLVEQRDVLNAKLDTAAGVRQRLAALTGRCLQLPERLPPADFFPLAEHPKECLLLEQTRAPSLRCPARRCPGARRTRPSARDAAR